MTTNGNSGSGIELSLSSGFTIGIKPMPPYYIDVIEEILPLPEYPTRKIVLAAGDIADWPYTPDEAAADPSHEDYTLYVKWKSTDAERQLVEKKRERARKDFLLANCVKVLNGPVDFQEEEWVNAVEAAFEDYTVPEHYGKRMLIFLKTQVISTPEELELIVGYALSQEVAMQGIIRALQGFQRQVEEQQSLGNHRKKAKRQHGS